jgi:hypothetical protein
MLAGFHQTRDDVVSAPLDIGPAFSADNTAKNSGWDVEGRTLPRQVTLWRLRRPSVEIRQQQQANQGCKR